MKSLRMPLFGLFVVALLWNVGAWWPKGVDVPKDEDVRRSLGQTVVVWARPMGLPFAIALAGVALATGAVGVRNAFGFLLRGRSSSPARAARALYVMESSYITGCAVISFLGIALILLVLRSAAGPAHAHPGPQAVAQAMQFVLATPLAAFVFGRIWLGTASDAAYRAAGLERPRRLWNDFALVTLLVPSFFAFYAMFWKAPTIQ